MRQRFEPQLVNGCFGDPALYVDLRDERRALLFDLGDIGVLPPRKLMRLSDVFVTHAHIDHFIGFDQLLRVVLGRKAALRLYGGPGFIGQIEHKLAAYSWNVVHRYELPLLFDVVEVTPAQLRRARFDSGTSFVRHAGGTVARDGDVVHAEEAFRIRARFVDHEMPCLAYLLEEAAHVVVWKNRLADLGLTTGPWLRAARCAVLGGASPDTPIEVAWHDRGGLHTTTRPLGEVQPALRTMPGRRIAYVTDLRYTPANLEVLDGLLRGVDMLFIESPFLHSDAEHAARKNHLTAQQAGSIARRVGARAVVPFHFSPRYQDRAAEVLAEVQAAWAGA